MLMGMRVAMAQAFGRHEHHMAVADAAFGNHLTGERLDFLPLPFEHRDLQATRFVQMDVQGCLRKIVMIVEALGQAFGQLSGVVIVHINQRRDAVLRARHLNRCLL